MKPGIHPDYRPVLFVDRATGDAFVTGSTVVTSRTEEFEGVTYPAVTVDISRYSHPMWTGQHREMDTQGRIEKFRRRYQKS